MFDCDAISMISTFGSTPAYRRHYRVLSSPLFLVPLPSTTAFLPQYSVSISLDSISIGWLRVCSSPFAWSGKCVRNETEKKVIKNPPQKKIFGKPWFDLFSSSASSWVLRAVENNEIKINTQNFLVRASVQPEWKKITSPFSKIRSNEELVRGIWWKSRLNQRNNETEHVFFCVLSSDLISLLISLKKKKKIQEPVGVAASTKQ